VVFVAILDVLMIITLAVTMVVSVEGAVLNAGVQDGRMGLKNGFHVLN
jgi:hypothetical protein